jgi:hypothetical protein
LLVKTEKDSLWKTFWVCLSHRIMDIN